MHLFDYFVQRKIPKRVFKFKYKIMHISDTPSMTFSFIKRLIRIIEPDVIIHTGDCVDEVKLEIHPELSHIYDHKLQELMLVLNQAQVPYYIILGNHDLIESLETYKNNLGHIGNRFDLNFKNIHCILSHYYENVSDPSVNMCFFGHDFTKDSISEKSRTLLNGLNGIYIVDGVSKAVDVIAYPNGTDDQRQQKYKLGI